MVGPPQRTPQAGVPQGWAFVQENMVSNVQQALGIYQANLGATGNERTGAAIVQRKTQGEHSQFHFFDNASMAIEQTGRIIVDLIPKIYDTEKIMKVRGEDGILKQIFLNPEMMNVYAEKKNEYEELIGYEINPTVGEYDVVMSSGPSSATKRQETSKAMFALAGQNPEVMRIGGDIMVRNMDFPGAQELANRLERTIPPEIVDPDPEMSPQMQQMMKQIEELGAENDSLKMGFEADMAKQQDANQAKLQQEQMTQENENLRTQAKLEADKEIAVLTEAGRIKASRINAKGEVREELIKNQGKYKSILLSQGHSPEQVESMLSIFQKVLRDEEVLEDQPLDKMGMIQDAQPEQQQTSEFIDEF